MRIVTDPVVDSIAFLIKHFGFPLVSKALDLLLNLLTWLMMFIVATIAGQGSADTVSLNVSSAVSNSPGSNFYVLICYL